MITKTRQNWQVGAEIRCGFLRLVVKAAIATPGDHRPDQYLLASAAGDRLYTFTPHLGLERIGLVEARELIATAQRRAAEFAAQVTERARQSSAQASAVDALFAEVA